MENKVPAVPGKGLKFARCLHFHWKLNQLIKILLVKPSVTSSKTGYFQGNYIQTPKD